MRKIFLSIFFILCMAFFPLTANASENFSSYYEVTYDVSESGTTHVLFNVSLANNTTNYYASSYKIEVGFQDIINVSASDQNGSIKPGITKSDFGQDVELNFNSRVVGKGNKLVFNLAFDTNEIAKKRGKIWEVNIPGLSNQNEFSDFNIHVKVPQSFGKPAYIKPPQTNMNLDFTREQLGKSGISIAFGEKQIYSFNLKYHLKNSNVFPIKTEVAVPPSTNYQTITIDSFFPKPSNVVEDKDGNWLAQYYLKPYEKIDVAVKGKVALYLYPKEQALSAEEKKEYLKEKKYWEISNEKIIELAKSLKTPLAIYSYVVKKLNYDFSRVSENKPRLGAVNTLAKPDSAVCLEFTDLFIALARAAGIPARELDGFALTDNSRQRPVSLVKDILHAWPEYYDNDLKTWVMVDPTWQNTTGGVDYFNVLDFDHFAFTIKGYSSEYPIPAGGYKLQGFENTKDVEVEFIDNFNESAPRAQVMTNFPKQVLSGLPIKGEVMIKNIGQGIVDSQNILIESDALAPHLQNFTLQRTPPFGYTVIPVEFQRTKFLTRINATVKIFFAGNTVRNIMFISPLLLSDQQLLLGGGVICVIILFIVVARTGCLPFFKQKGRDNLRRESEKP